MSQSKGWNWDEVNDAYWSKPSEETYFLLNRWKNKEYNKVLDLGCGRGRHSIFFAENGFYVTGYDLSESGLSTLRKIEKDRNLGIEIVLGDIRELPFDNGVFDAILAFHSIYHTNTEGMLEIIKEVKRVLKDGGEIYVTLLSKVDLSFNDVKYKKIDKNTKMKLEQDNTIVPHFYINQEELYELLEGFEVIRLRQVEDIFNGKSSWHYFIHAKKSVY